MHLSACLSGTVDNARLAAEEVNEALAGGPVTVVDTGTCSGGVGLAALAAAGAPDARRGAALALESASRSRVLFLVRTCVAGGGSTARRPCGGRPWGSTRSWRSVAGASWSRRPCAARPGPGATSWPVQCGRRGAPP